MIENCTSTKNETQTLIEIDRGYGGKGNGAVVEKIDLEMHFKEKGCVACANNTKKITFFASSTSDGQAGKGYFFLNLKAGEAFMPNAAMQQFMAGQEGAGQVVIDQFIRNNKIEQYMVAEGKKYHHTMALGTSISVIKNDAINEQRFKKDFKTTGKKRKHLNTALVETEYTGKDDEGKTISFWIVPMPDVCLPPGKFDAFGFYNLGYISVDGTTFLVTEISGQGFEIKVTDIADGSYTFNPAGYQNY